MTMTERVHGAARDVGDVARDAARGAKSAAVDAAAAVKPKLRGVSHQVAFFATLPLGAAMVVAASGARARVAVAVYVLSLAGLFGTSALYHRRHWRPDARRWMRRLDHSMIFVLIAGTYTPIAVLALDGALATGILVAVWAGAFAGVVLKLVWIDAPKPLIAGLYVALGWVAVFAAGALPSAVGWLGVAGLVAGGLLYTAGAVVYATQRPDPVPAVFGYHEVFHAFTIVAALCHLAVVAFAVLPRA